jgi:hypothetical protein
LIRSWGGTAAALFDGAMFVALPGIEGASTAETEMTPEQKKKFGESRVAALAMIYTPHTMISH